MKRDAGLLLLLLALALSIALYAPSFNRGLVNYDDSWLIADNWILRDHDIGKVFTDTSFDTRAVLGAEYLPVRDLSVIADDALWADWYGGHHLTNLVLYLAAIALWFAALTRLELDRTLVGLTCLLWAVHPAHAESVAWLSERKGLLAIALAGLVVLGFAQFKRGRSWWLAVAIIAAIAAVWSKALALFMFAPLVLVAKDRRGWSGLVAIGAAAVLAFVPVFLVARQMSVVASESTHSASWLGIHGFYVRLSAMTMRNSVAYPIATDGASTIDVLVGAAALLAALAVFIPRVRAPAAVRLGSAMWLAGWFPVSRLVLPVKLVLVADRYLLFPSLGIALVVACGLLRVPFRRVLIGVVVLAACARTLDAQANWRNAATLWARAVDVSPRDSDAWSQYVEALEDNGNHAAAQTALEHALATASSGRLMMHQALFLVREDKTSEAQAWMQRAAEAGEPRAMANLALMLDEEGKHADAIAWAKRAVERMPLYVNGLRILGRVTIASGDAKNALPPFERALALAPHELVNEYNVGIALTALGRYDEARPHLMKCLRDPTLAPRVRQLFGH